MFKEKESFLRKMMNTINHDYEEEEDGDLYEEDGEKKIVKNEEEDGNWIEEETVEGQLSIDMHETPKEIIIHTIVAGVKPEDLDISINREMIIINGSRTQQKKHATDDYFHEELYWGKFTRTILLPQEIQVEDAEATTHNGLLTITLPKIDKNRTHKLKVKKGP